MTAFRTKVMQIHSPDALSPNGESHFSQHIHRIIRLDHHCTLHVWFIRSLCNQYPIPPSLKSMVFYNHAVQPLPCEFWHLSLQSRQQARYSDGASEQRGNTIFSAPTRRNIDAKDMVHVSIDVEFDRLVDGMVMVWICVMYAL